jgi:hypothetical protein
MLTSTQTIFLDLTDLYVENDKLEQSYNLLNEALEKVSRAFSGTNFEIVTTPPIDKEYAVLKIINGESESALGSAEYNLFASSHSQGNINFDNVLNCIDNNSLEFEQSTNLLSNTITHEIGHMAGLDHNDDPTNIMHDGLTPTMLANEPMYSLTLEQIQAINTNAVISNSHQMNESFITDNYTDEIGQERMNHSEFISSDENAFRSESEYDDDNSIIN